MARPRSATKPARDRAIARDYAAGILQDDLAARYGMTQSSISKILAAQGARLSGSELLRRVSPHNRRPQRPASPHRGRPALPLHEHERPLYEKLRREFNAAYAREQMWIRLS